MPFDRKAYMKAYKKKHPEKFRKPIKKKQAVKIKPMEETNTEFTPHEEIKETQPVPDPPKEETTAPAEEIKEETPPVGAPQEETKGNDADFFAEMRNEYKAAEEKPAEEVKVEEVKADPIPETNKMLISGYMFLLAVNIIYPDLLLGMLKFVSKKYAKVNSDNISLDETQIEMLEEIADEFIKVYLPQVNPLWLFLICLNGMYFQNIKRELKRITPIAV